MQEKGINLEALIGTSNIIIIDIDLDNTSSGIIVFDDFLKKHNSSLNQLLAIYPYVKSPSGGFHIWMRRSDMIDVKKIKGKFDIMNKVEAIVSNKITCPPSIYGG